MKNFTISILVVLVVIMAIVSCSAFSIRDDLKVSGVVIAFVEDFYIDCDFDKALSLCEGDAYNVAEHSANNVKETYSDEEIKKWVETSSFDTVKVETKEIVIKGNKASVDLTIQPSDEQITTWKYKLEKIDREWKIVSIEKIIPADGII